MATQVTCPHCRATLKSNKPVPAGFAINCPKCKQRFRTPEASSAPEQVTAVAVGAGAAGSAPAPTSVQANEPAYVPPSGRPVSEPVIDIARPPRGMSTAGRLALVLGSVVALLAVGVGLTVWCFSGSSTPSNQAGDDKDKLAQKGEPGKRKKEKVVILTAEEQALVDLMKQKGLDYLRRTQLADGSWEFANQPAHQVDMAAMGALTLLECGASNNDPAVQKAAALVRKHVPNMTKTYGSALFTLFLVKLGEAQDQKAIRTLALRFVAGQTAQGGWGYDLPALSEAEENDIERVLRDIGSVQPWRKQVEKNPNWLTTLPGRAQALGLFHTPDNGSAEHFRHGGDNSNTQFALLALLAARRQGLAVDQSLAASVKRFRASQFADGHWEYHNGSLGEASNMAMTSAGLLALAIGYGLDFPDSTPHKVPTKDPQVMKGLAYVGTKINRTKSNDEKIYALWSVERAGMLFRLPEIGGKDWFRWGLRVLKHHQKEDGSWNFGAHDGFAASTDTCFALLFLQQVNLTYDLTDKFELLHEAMGAIAGKQD